MTCNDDLDLLKNCNIETNAQLSQWMCPEDRKRHIMFGPM